MKTREDIITGMCYTFRHDYGAPFQPWEEVFGQPMIDIENGSDGIGMSEREREVLWNQMAQLFDNDIAPYMDFKQSESD